MWKRKKSQLELRLELKDKKIMELVEKMLESDLEIHAGSDEYLILDREKQIFVCINDSMIRICNHDYTYEVPISGNQATKYGKKVREKIQTGIDNIKKEIFKNEIDLIDHIKSIYNEETD